MRNRMTHTNSSGETLDFLDLGIYITDMELRDWEYTVESKNEHITRIYKGIVTRTIPFAFCCDKDRAADIKNQFYEHFEQDILSGSMGYFEINGYRLYCYAIKSVKNDYLEAVRLLKIEVEITTDQPNWIRETTYSFIKDSAAVITEESKTYDYTYDYVYGRNIGNAVIQLDDTLSASSFRLIIYGNVSNPAITIGNNIYNVNVDLETSERVEIDSRDKTIYITHQDGSRTNAFNMRSYENSVFEKIIPGRNQVVWPGTYGFDLIIYEERGEPVWK